MSDRLTKYSLTPDFANIALLILKPQKSYPADASVKRANPDISAYMHTF